MRSKKNPLDPEQLHQVWESLGQERKQMFFFMVEREDKGPAMWWGQLVDKQTWDFKIQRAKKIAWIKDNLNRGALCIGQKCWTACIIKGLLKSSGLCNIECVHCVWDRAKKTPYLQKSRATSEIMAEFEWEMQKPHPASWLSFPRA